MGYMYDVIIVGAGIAGLNAARLLNNNNRKICILEKTNRIGGMIHSKFINITKKNKHKIKNKTLKNKSSKKKVKFETGGAVVYSYQKNMTQLIDKFNIDVFKLPVDKNGKHHKDIFDGNTKKPLSKSQIQRYYSLLKKYLGIWILKVLLIVENLLLNKSHFKLSLLMIFVLLNFVMVTLILFVYLILLLPKLIFKMNYLTVKIF